MVAIDRIPCPPTPARIISVFMIFLAPGGWIITNTVPFVNITNYPAEEQLTETLAKYPNVVAFDMDETAKEVATVRSCEIGCMVFFYT